MLFYLKKKNRSILIDLLCNDSEAHLAWASLLWWCERQSPYIWLYIHCVVSISGLCQEQGTLYPLKLLWNESKSNYTAVRSGQNNFGILRDWFFSCKSDSTITHVRLSVCPSVCHRNPSASQNPVYLLLSLSLDLKDLWSQRSLIFQLRYLWSMRSLFSQIFDLLTLESLILHDMRFKIRSPIFVINSSECFSFSLCSSLLNTIKF